MKSRLWTTVIFAGAALIVAMLVSGQSQSTEAGSLPPSINAVSVPRLAPTLSNRVFLPLIMGSPALASVDLTITGLEVTQSVQDTANSVSLVANRPTVVRVYAQADSSSSIPTYVDLSGTRGGVPLPGSPLRVGTMLVPTSPSRGSYSSSFNFALPASWESGSVSLLVQVDPTNLVVETNESNNTTTMVIAFNTVPPLNLKIVPINYTHTPTGAFYPGPNVDRMSDWIMRSYPLSAINVSFRAPFAFSGDLTLPSGWTSLLDAVTTARTYDGAPASQEYVGLIPYGYPNGWGTPAWGGFAWIGWSRTAILLNYPIPPFATDDTGKLAAHEIGHNFGLYHAPCGNPANPDPNYPYAGGSSGQYGLDTTYSRVWSPASPDFTKDVMSYCYPQWWSDYDYRKLYNDQVVHGLAPIRQPVQTGLLIRATINGNGTPAFSPVYSLSAAVTAVPAASDYAIQLLDQTGATIASYPVAVLEAEEQGLHARSISAVVPQPAQPVAAVQLLSGGNPVAERAFALSRTPIAAPTVTQAADALTINWSAPQQPVLVRYVPDNSDSPVTLGVDVLSDELRVDPRMLPGGAGHVEVVLADGAVPAAARAPVSAVTLPDSTPVAWITGPTTIKAGAPLILFGHGANREEGALSDLRWVVDGNDVAVGATLQVERLAVGSHTVTLAARDANGKTALASYVVIVAR